MITDTSEGAKFPNPILTEPTVINNADGTQTLTWMIPDVKIGELMAPIYYSVDIGSSDPEQDVSIGTTELKNTAYITAPDDLRDPLKTAEKHAEAGLTVNRGSASSFGKYTRQKVVEEDGEIDYVVYFNNNADTAAKVVIMDTMPENGVGGSEFTGTYSLAEWKLDTTKCDAGKISIYYTFNEEYQNKTTKEVKEEEITSGQWDQAEIAADGTIAIPEPPEGKQHPTAWAVVGELDSKKSVYIDLKIKLEPGASETDKDKTNYFVNRLSSGDTTTTTENPTVRRTLEGLTWLDYNRDGIQPADADTEPRISGVKVELLKLKEGGDPLKEESYENVCYAGTDIPISIETGKQISIRAEVKQEEEAEKAAIDYEEGRYKFLDLPAGTFSVRFTDGKTQTITKLNATLSNHGKDDAIDSDGIPVLDTDGQLQKTVILNLGMPKAEEINTSVYESKYHDSGFYPGTLMKVRKVDAEKNKSLAGAVFTIQNAEGTLLSFTNVQGEGYYLEGYGKAGSDSEEAELITKLTVDNSGKLNIYNLLPGTYTITEIEAPDGYTLLKEPVSFTLKMNGTDSFIELNTSDGNNGLVSVEAEDEKAVVLKVQNEKLYELPKTGGTGTFVYTISGTLLMLAAALILYKKKEFIKSRQSL